MQKYRRRPRLTEAEKAMLWNRWQQGDSSFMKAGDKSKQFDFCLTIIE